MAKIRPIKRSFNAGILSPVMYGQVDFDKWASAVKYMKNFIPLPQGPARRRGGTQYAGSVKNSSDRVWLASFQFSTTEAFILGVWPSDTSGSGTTMRNCWMAITTFLKLIRRGELMI